MPGKDRLEEQKADALAGASRGLDELRQATTLPAVDDAVERVHGEVEVAVKAARILIKESGE